MARQPVTCFAVYPFMIGEKIRIEDSNRLGNWEVIGVDDRNVRLRYTVSGQEVEWARFGDLVSVNENIARPGASANRPYEVKR